jgi:small conductance mechanosensitive channel
VTSVTTLDNVRTFVGNAKVLGDNIQNLTALPYRQVELTAQLDNSVGHAEAIRLLKERLRRIPNVMTEPAPDVEILTFTPLGPVLAVRPYCHNDHYWPVYFDTNRSIREVGGDANFPAPQQHVFVSGAP